MGLAHSHCEDGRAHLTCFIYFSSLTPTGTDFSEVFFWVVGCKSAEIIKMLSSKGSSGKETGQRASLQQGTLHEATWLLSGRGSSLT